MNKLQEFFLKRRSLPADIGVVAAAVLVFVVVPAFAIAGVLRAFGVQ